MKESTLKSDVKNHWNKETCGTRFASSENRKAYFDEIEESRYKVEPYIKPFAEFEKGKSKTMLEIGVGAGTDFSNWVKSGAIVTGIDLTQAGIDLTRERLELAGLKSYKLMVADAENLSFSNDSFEFVYSFGVLHHSPDPIQCFKEVFRVLKKDGEAKIMVYSDFSMTGIMLWVRHALLKGKPWLSQKKVIYDHLESPGTKCYSVKELTAIFSEIGFKNIQCRKQIGCGDLLLMPPSTKYKGVFYKLIWRLYPRWLIQLFGDSVGLNLMCTIKK